MMKKNNDYYKYKYVNQKESTPIDKVFIVLTANFLECKITVISYKDIWSTDEREGVDIVLALFGNSKFSNTQVGTYYFHDLLIIYTRHGERVAKSDQFPNVV